MAVRKIKAGRVNSITMDQFVGEQGTLFYDDETGDMRLSNGSTTGGMQITQNILKTNSIILNGFTLQISNPGILTINGQPLIDVVTLDGGSSNTVFTANFLHINGGFSAVIFSNLDFPIDGGGA